jgi:hypothetical protein
MAFGCALGLAKSIDLINDIGVEFFLNTIEN